MSAAEPRRLIGVGLSMVCALAACTKSEPPGASSPEESPSKRAAVEATDPEVAVAVKTPESVPAAREAPSAPPSPLNETSYGDIWKKLGATPPAASTAPKPKRAAPPKPKTHGFLFAGTMTLGSKAYAILRTPKGEHTLAAAGSQVETAKVVKVDKTKVVIEVDGETFELTPDEKACGGGTKTSRPRPRSSPSRRRPTRPPGLPRPTKRTTRR